MALFHRLIPASPGHEWLYAASLDPHRIYQVESRKQSLRISRFGGLIKQITTVQINPDGLTMRTADRHRSLDDGSDAFRCSGAALSAGVPIAQRFCGAGYHEALRMEGDFLSNIYLIRPTEEEEKKKRPVFIKKAKKK